MSTGESALMPYSWGVKAGMAHSTADSTCAWQVTLNAPSLTRATSKCPRDECQLTIIVLYKSMVKFTLPLPGNSWKVWDNGVFP